MTLSISTVLTISAVLSLSLISPKKMFKMINVKIIVAVKPARPTICLMASGSSLYFFKLFSNNIVLSNSAQLIRRLSRCLS